MYRFLKIVLILIGVIVILYGGYTILTPGFSLNDGPVRAEVQGNHTQAYAMVVFGFLMILAGLAFRKGR
ncbi:hypothetical protein [Salinimicrobium sp. GXAS 041]|uniref:hypothetical protein n=1 Tax=Salinimicrobium sp. GXAS 041 TaxID=3400806 RepID=UPI003C7199C5